MNLQELQLLLPAGSVGNVAGEFTRYERSGGEEGVDGFIRDLHERRIITPTLFHEIHARADVVVQGLTGLARLADLAGGLNPLVAHDDDEDDEVTTVVPALQEKHKLLGIVGVGGMATVHVAWESVLGRKVAFKQILPALRKDRRLMSRFFAEAQVTAQLDHPNVVPVYALDLEREDAPGYTMKLIEGRNFKELLDEARALCDKDEELPERLSLENRLQAFLAVCDALAYAHDKGVIHRDLKPENIMVGRYKQVYVMDWGLARLIEADDGNADATVDNVSIFEQDGGESRKTRVGAVLGTPAYMAPEQALGQHNILDGRTDQYALGLILQEVVTLKPAMAGEGATGMISSAAQGKRLPVEHVTGEPVDPELEAILAKSMQLEMSARYASVYEMAEDIRRHLRGEPTSVLPDSLPRKLRRWVGHHSGKTLVLLLAVLLLAALSLSWSFWRQVEAAKRAGEVGRRLTEFTTAVAERGHRIDNRFMGLQSQLESMAVSAVHLLEMKKPEHTRAYIDEGPDSAPPPDSVLSKAYGTEISLAHPVFKVAPGVKVDTVRSLINRLAPLGGSFRRMLAETIDPAAQRWSVAKQARRIRQKGSPVTWAYVGLVEGVHVGYPGEGGYPADFDPRNRPWYRLSADHLDVRVGNPYIDVKAQGLLLPMSKSLYDSAGRFRGVAGVDLKFEFIIGTMLDLSKSPGVLATYLIDDRGRIVVSARDLARRVTAGLHDDEALRLKPYSYAPTVELMVQGRSGNARFERDGKEVLVVWFRLTGLGWFYLAEAEYAAVVGGG